MVDVYGNLRRVKNTQECVMLNMHGSKLIMNGLDINYFTPRLYSSSLE